jgi:ribonuclease G
MRCLFQSQNVAIQMTSHWVLISSQPGEDRIAVMEGQRLTDIIFNRSKASGIVGNIYLGRVEKVLIGLQAAFIDIGEGRSGFLGVADARMKQSQGNLVENSISKYVKEGDKLLVQVSRDAFENKGPKLSLQISLSGRFMVLAPSQSTIKISRRLGDAEERNRLSRILTELANEGDGIIVRTAAGGTLEKDLSDDLDQLRLLWQGIEEKSANEKAPQLVLDQAGSIYRNLVDLGVVNAERITIDDVDVLTELKREFGQVEAQNNRLEHYTGAIELFENFGIEEQIDAALSGTIILPSGGSVMIDEARALTAIDVNTGASKSGLPEELAFRTNLEAVDIIAQEVRLQNLSGLIVIDVVSMRRKPNRTKILAQLRNAMKTDPIPTHVLGYTKLGLIEMTRERRRESLTTILCGANTGMREKSPLSKALDALRQVRREAHVHAGRALMLTAAQPVIDALQGEARAAMAATNLNLGHPFALEAAPAEAIRSFHIRVLEKDER